MGISSHHSRSAWLPYRLCFGKGSRADRCAVAYKFQAQQRWRIPCASRPGGCGARIHPAFPAQEEDVSFGLIGGDPTFAYPLAHPTPGAPNETIAPRTKPVTFSPPSGMFKDSLRVALTTATPGAQIFYTINGATPSPVTGILYTAPISLWQPRACELLRSPATSRAPSVARITRGSAQIVGLHIGAPAARHREFRPGRYSSKRVERQWFGVQQVSATDGLLGGVRAGGLDRNIWRCAADARPHRHPWARRLFDDMESETIQRRID